MTSAPDSSAVRTALWRAHATGFSEVRSVPTDELAAQYLAGRTDGLRPAGGEGMLLARI